MLQAYWCLSLYWPVISLNLTHKQCTGLDIHTWTKMQTLRHTFACLLADFLTFAPTQPCFFSYFLFLFPSVATWKCRTWHLGQILQEKCKNKTPYHHGHNFAQGAEIMWFMVSIPQIGTKYVCVLRTIGSRNQITLNTFYEVLRFLVYS